jgi:hypothetical protein
VDTQLEQAETEILNSIGELAIAQVEPGAGALGAGGDGP